MNGSENSYAGALFFALMSLGAVLKIEDFIIGCAVGAVCAILAAIIFRRALNRSAQAKEEDYQRIEVQFQQLRSKINETSTVNITAMNSLNDAAQLLKENMQIIHDSLSGLDKLPELVQNVATISSSVASFEENSSAFNAGLEKISIAVEAQEKLSTTEEFKNLIAIQEVNKTNILTALKILHAIAQMIKAPVYMQELEKINSSVKLLTERTAVFDALKNSVADMQKNISNLVKAKGELSSSFATALDDTQKGISELIATNNDLLKDFTTTFDGTQKNLSESIETNSETLKDFMMTLDGTQKNLSESIEANGELLKDFIMALDAIQRNISDLVKNNNELSRDLTTTFDNTQKNLYELVKSNNASSEDLIITLDDAQKNLNNLVKTNNDISKDFNTTLDELRLNVAQFSDKLDSFIDSSKEHNLTEEDVDLLKKIMAKINRK